MNLFEMKGSIQVDERNSIYGSAEKRSTLQSSESQEETAASPHTGRESASEVGHRPQVRVLETKESCQQSNKTVYTIGVQSICQGK